MISPTDVEHQFAQVADGISLHYVDVGPRDATPLVLVHGWPDLWYAWRYQIKPLSEKYRVVVPTLRGFGRSSAPHDVTKYGSKNVTDDLARLLDVLEIPKAVFIGHDWGGAMVWRMCLYHPTRVLAVCGICTPYFPPSPVLIDIDAFVAKAPQMEYMKLLADSQATSKRLDAAPRKFFTACYRPYTELQGEVSVYDMIVKLPESEDPEYTVPSTLLSEAELDYYVAEYTHSGFHGTANYYATREMDFEAERGMPMVISHKALYIGARDDRVLRPEMAAHMPKLMPNLEMEMIAEAGHWILWEQPDKVSETILSWLARVEAAAP